jgi:hypothetical protein
MGIFSLRDRTLGTPRDASSSLARSLININFKLIL